MTTIMSYLISILASIVGGLILHFILKAFETENKFVFISILAIIVISIFAIRSHLILKAEEDLWSYTVSRDNIQSYDTYLQKYPTGRYACLAMETIKSINEEADWSNTITINTIAAYENFISTYPQSKHLQDAKTAIQNLTDSVIVTPPQTENELWDWALNKSTISSYERYLSEYPSGRYSSIARGEISILKERLAWEEAAALNTIDAYRDFTIQYPNSHYTSEALSAIKLLENTIETGTDPSEDHSVSDNVGDIQITNYDLMIWYYKDEEIETLYIVFNKNPLYSDYTLQYKERHVNWDEAKSTNEVEEDFGEDWSKGYYFRVYKDTTQGVIYDFRLRARDNDNFIYSEPVTITIPINDLSGPANVVVEDIGSTDITLSWDAVTKATEYDAHWYLPDDSNLGIITSDNLITLEDLVPDTQYEIYIEAIYSYLDNEDVLGEVSISRPSKPIIVTTNKNDEP